jgi:AcrR family transcriptional regulator
MSLTSLQLNPLHSSREQKLGWDCIEQILNAAAEVFTEVGYEAATAHLIATRTGATVGSQFHLVR